MVTRFKFLIFLKCSMFLVATALFLVSAIAAINVSLTPTGWPSDSSCE